MMKRASVRFTISRVAQRKAPGAVGSNSTHGEAPKKSSGSTASGAGGISTPIELLHRLSGSRRFDYSLLITDDDAAFRETLRNIFEPEGFQTLLAHSGEEALDILRNHPVHLALLDQHMPRLTGLETLRIIRQRNTILPVILMTADSTQQLMRDALSAHAFCVMSKSVTRNVVVYTVHQALSRSYDHSGTIASEGKRDGTL
jgi:CheY-like chemotaxis protein